MNISGGLLSDDMKQYLLSQGLLNAGANMLTAGAPSTDPRSGSLAYAMGQGLQGFNQGQQGGLSNLMSGMQIQILQKKMADEEKRRKYLETLSATTTVDAPLANIIKMAQAGVIPFEKVADFQMDKEREREKRTYEEGKEESKKVAGMEALGIPMQRTPLADMMMTAPNQMLPRMAIPQLGELNRTPEQEQQAGLIRAGVSPETISQNRKLNYDMKTLYGPGGTTKEVPVLRGQEYTPPKGWTLASPALGASNIVVVPTDRGALVVNKKAGTASPVKTETGEAVYSKTPSEVKVAAKNINDNIAAVAGVKEVYNAGLVGPVTGRAHKYGSRFFSDKEFTQLKNRVGQLRTIVYGLSGKQINETELQWLKDEILPNLMYPSDNFEVTLNEYEAWVKRNKSLLEEQYPALGQQMPQRRATDGIKVKRYNPSTGRIE